MSDSDLEVVSVLDTSKKNTSKIWTLSSASECSDVELEEAKNDAQAGTIKCKSESSSDELQPMRRKRPLQCLVDTDSDDKTAVKFKERVKSAKKKLRRANYQDSGSDSDDKPLISFMKFGQPVPSDRSLRQKKVKVDEDSYESSSSDEKENTRQGRRNIRPIIPKRYLDKATKRATREEESRKKRIEKHLVLLGAVEPTLKIDTITSNAVRIILDVDKATKEVLLEVDPHLASKLKAHQIEGIKFMWNACFESCAAIQKSPNSGSGCILSHCMGLGKTFSIIALLHTLMANQDRTTMKRVLIVAPKNTIANWHAEFRQWLMYADNSDCIRIYDIYGVQGLMNRAAELDEWHVNGGVMLISYNMFRLLTLECEFKPDNDPDVCTYIRQALFNEGPDLVVCDEGHLLKNEETQISKAMCRIRTKRRIVLTGTPLQNNLKEYYVMVNFVKPNLLGCRMEFMNRFAIPIVNGQFADSSIDDVRQMRLQSYVLHRTLRSTIHRCDYDVLAPLLPPKHEYILSIRLTDLQVLLYDYYMRHFAYDINSNEAQDNTLFADFNALQRVWTHPLVLRYASDRYMDRQRALRRRAARMRAAEGLFDDNMSDTENEEDSDEEDIPGDVSLFGADDDSAEEPVSTSKKAYNPTEWWMPLVPDDALTNLEYSGKFMMLMAILEECDKIGDKLLVFSQSLYTLDAIEHFLRQLDEQNQKKSANDQQFKGNWKRGLDYFRLDGKTPSDQRLELCNEFNRFDNYRTRLFLISTKAGGLGINLTGANRVVIFDCCWNPSHDIQSIFRVYRFGQKKTCYIYRFSALGTMEDRIYERQVTKQAISKRVVDAHQIKRHYLMADLIELYRCNLRPAEPRPLPIFPKDRVLAEMLKKYMAIYKYHVHDSLLKNQVEEVLNEDETNAAWQDYEAKKNSNGNSREDPALVAFTGSESGFFTTKRKSRAFLPTEKRQMKGGRKR